MQGRTTSKFIYDTGSGYVTIPENNCFSCSLGFKYNPSDSSTYVDANHGYDITSLAYGSANLRGAMGEDTVCLTPTQTHSCVENFAFFMI